MSGPSRIVFRAARAMICDGVIVSGLALALLDDAYLVARIGALVAAPGSAW